MFPGGSDRRNSGSERRIAIAARPRPTTLWIARVYALEGLCVGAAEVAGLLRNRIASRSDAATLAGKYPRAKVWPAGQTECSCKV